MSKAVPAPVMTTASGLEQLMCTPGICIDQQLEGMPVLSGIQQMNCFRISSTVWPSGYANQSALGNSLFWSCETSSLGIRYSEARNRAIRFAVYQTGNSNPVLIIERPFKTMRERFGKSVKVYDGQNRLLGRIKKSMTIPGMGSKLVIYNGSNQELASIRGPASHNNTWAEMNIMLGDIKSGRVWRKGHDHYEVLFPQNADMGMRALLMACPLFIDALYSQ